ncbi:MAG: hypothetical protein JXR96_26080 [Deltaproteobacteria bacterium]|nr:hypothetical protein [Deltaproteobacteria bacterium]
MRTVILIGLCWMVAGCGVGGDSGCADCDVTGYWLGYYQSEEKNGKFSAEIVQTGQVISGQFESGSGMLEGASLDGTVEGGRISFGDGDAQIHFSGTVFEDLSASGSFSLAAAGVEGEWRASLAERGAFELAECIEIDSYGVSALAHDGDHLWYIDGSGNLKKADETGQVLAEYDTPTAGGGMRLAYGDGSIWYAHFGTVARIDLDGQILEQTEIEKNATGLAYADGSLWIVDFEYEELHRLDAEHAVAESITLSVPHARSMAFDGERLWIVSGQFLPSRQIAAVDLDGLARAYCDLPADFEVGDVAFDGQSLWIGSDVYGQGDARICRLVHTGS